MGPGFWKIFIGWPKKSKQDEEEVRDIDALVSQRSATGQTKREARGDV